ncbi:hypothetical protein EDB83DRAFT_2365998 [Lactarius deliciosus]|nr:hypothetical protein EDB83DRAFT_2365998 [Lactarius deliciosus]
MFLVIDAPGLLSADTTAGDTVTFLLGVPVSSMKMSNYKERHMRRKASRHQMVESLIYFPLWSSLLSLLISITAGGTSS